MLKFAPVKSEIIPLFEWELQRQFTLQSLECFFAFCPLLVTFLLSRTLTTCPEFIKIAKTLDKIIPEWHSKFYLIFVRWGIQVSVQITQNTIVEEVIRDCLFLVYPFHNLRARCDSAKTLVPCFKLKSVRWYRWMCCTLVLRIKLLMEFFGLCYLRHSNTFWLCVSKFWGIEYL